MLDDVVVVIHHLLARSDLAGPVNASSPEPVTNAELTKTLGRVLGRPTIVPVPAFVLRIAFGEVADADSRAVVDAIAATPTAAQDRPVDPVVIESVTVERVGA